MPTIIPRPVPKVHSRIYFNCPFFCPSYPLAAPCGHQEYFREILRDSDNSFLQPISDFWLFCMILPCSHLYCRECLLLIPCRHPDCKKRQYHANGKTNTNFLANQCQCQRPGAHIPALSSTNASVSSARVLIISASGSRSSHPRPTGPAARPKQGEDNGTANPCAFHAASNRTVYQCKCG